MRAHLALFGLFALGAGTARAEGPAIDLLANRYRWHLHTPSGGLFIPAAGEGLRKYVNEYHDPWGKPLNAGDRPARALTARAATLRFPWTGGTGPGSLRLWIHGVAPGQRLTVKVNGRAVKSQPLEPAWQLVRAELGADVLAKGENTLSIALARRGSFAGQKAYALVEGLEIRPGPGPEDARCPPQSPVAGGALTGFARYDLYLEVPERARLTFTSAGGPARLRVLAEPVDGAPTSLLDGAQDGAAPAPRVVDLGGLGGHVTRLSLETNAPAVTFSAPRIELAPAPEAPRPGPYRNVIVWVGDALRSDHLSLYDPVYGKTDVRTPRIAAEARKQGVVFLHNQSGSTSSPPSHGSLQTGLIPRVHGVDGDAGKLSPGIKMLSVLVGEAGLATSYIGNNPFGMARLEKPGRWTEYHYPGREGRGSDCSALVEMSLDFVRRQAGAGKRFYLSTLAYEPHTPYRYHRGVTEHYFPGPFGPPIGTAPDGTLFGKIQSGAIKMDERRWAHFKALYKGEVEHMDGCVGRLLDGLEQLGVRSDTLVVLTSDHGEGMFEHGRLGHAFSLNAELADVPLVLLAPGLSPREVHTVTSSLDVVPTVLELLGLPPHPPVQGRSLVPLLRRPDAAPPNVVSIEYGRSYALRARRWKYLVGYSGEESLFHLPTDRFEREDVRRKQPLVLRYVRDLAGFFLAHRARWRGASWGSLSDHGPGLLEHAGDAAPRIAK